VLRPDGRPHQTAGVTPARGLFTVGLPWQTRRASGPLFGMQRDADVIAERIATAQPARISARG
jgi:hypothetical protein